MRVSVDSSSEADGQIERDREATARRARFRIVCTGCGQDLGGQFAPFCPSCGEMSDVAYDLAAVDLRTSSNPYVRFLDLLPIGEPELLPQAASFTPTVHARRLGERVGMERLYLKDETQLPTGTTKDRMAAIALPYLYEQGVRGFSTSSTGNSSSAYAHAIGRLPDLVMYLFTASQFRERLSLPQDDRIVDVILPGATFVEAFAAAGEFAKHAGLVAEQGFFNPGRREGLKLAWLEAVQQVPYEIDWYVQAVSSAMGVYGVFKGALELRELGRAERVPRLACVQQETCAPMVSAWCAGARQIRPQDVVHRPRGIAAAILRGDPSRVYPHVRRIVLQSGGTFLSVSEHQIRRARSLVEELEGISPCFSAATALAGLIELRRQGAIARGETVLVNLTGGERAGTPPAASAHTLERSERSWNFAPLERSACAPSPTPQ